MKLRYAIITVIFLCSGTQILLAEHQLNKLSDSEKRSGWRLLFDGKTTKGWRNYKKETVSDGWKIEEGVLSRVDKKAGDIITEEQFEGFELSLEFRISPKGNSGIMFHVTEDEKYPWQTGPEIQINDNINGHDPQKAGWLYQLYKPSAPGWMKRINKEAGIETVDVLDACNPAGQWNHVYFKQTAKQSEVMMNGVSYYRFVKGSKEWDKLVAASKFVRYKNFGKPTKGHICLQDHGDYVSYRNIKVRTLEKEFEVPDPIDGKLPLKPVEAFPGLEWENWKSVDENGKVQQMRPIVITHAGDQSGRIFVAMQAGIIHVLPEGEKTKKTVEFLDIRERVNHWKNAGEEGLLGLAFHPEYKKNGKFYLYYTSSEGKHVSTVSEFTVDPKNPNKALKDSERVLWKMPQLYSNHNGGTLEFGPDGYLYIALGDGGSGNDPFDNGQNLATWLGSILRIDVNKKEGEKQYAIPTDNPFVNTPWAKPEIYAYGLRNVWRLSFDSKTGDLWAADVGQNLWEEINLIKSGGNYGWNRNESLHRFGNRNKTLAANSIDPIWEYDHQVGKSITGGFVYRGNKLPELQGKYVYADFVLGKIWALDYDVKCKKLIGNYRIPSSKMAVMTFGADEAGEIYFSTQSATGKGIYRFAKDE